MTKTEYSTRISSTLPHNDEITRLLAGAGRPFVMATERELSVLRRGLTKEGWKRSLYLQDASGSTGELSGAGLLARANSWLDSTIVMPDCTTDAGSFFCDDGTPLEIPDLPDIPGRNYRCPACGHTYSGEAYDAALARIRHLDLTTGCLALGLIYQIDKDTAYADKAGQILLQYSECYSDQIPLPAPDEAACLVSLSQAYDLICLARVLTATERNLIENKLFEFAERLINDEQSESFGPWNVAAAGIVGCATKDHELLGKAIDAFVKLIDTEPGSDGLWSNSTEISHFSALKALVHFAEACCRLEIDLYNYRTPSGKGLKSMFLAPLGLAYPSYQLPAIGNASYEEVLPLPLYEIAYRRWGDASFARVLKTGYSFARKPKDDLHVRNRGQFTRSGLYAFLFGRDLPNRVQEPKIPSVLFNEHGIAVLRDHSDCMLVLDCGNPRHGKHNDQTSISFYGSSRILCPDYGTSMSSYYESAASHNTVLIDGGDKAPQSLLRTVNFQAGDYLQRASVELEKSRGIRHRRRTTLAGDIAIVQDWISSDSEHAYDWLLRCEGQPCEMPEAGPAECVSDHFADGRLVAEGSDFVTRWHTDKSGLSTFISTSVPCKLISGLCPAETMLKKVPVIDVRTCSTSVCYLSVLVPYQGETPIIDYRGRVVKICRENITDFIYFGNTSHNWPGEPLALDSDADFAAVRVENGEVTACGLYGGSSVSLNGINLVQGEAAFQRIEIRLDSRNPVISFDGPTGGHLRLKCRSRAMLVNSNKISATCVDGIATIKLVGVLAGEL